MAAVLKKTFHCGNERMEGVSRMEIGVAVSAKQRRAAVDFERRLCTCIPSTSDLTCKSCPNVVTR